MVAEPVNEISEPDAKYLFEAFRALSKIQHPSGRVRTVLESIRGLLLSGGWRLAADVKGRIQLVPAARPKKKATKKSARTSA